MADHWADLSASRVPALAGWWARFHPTGEARWLVELVEGTGAGATVRASSDLIGGDGLAPYVKVAELLRHVRGVVVADDYIDAVAAWESDRNLADLPMLAGPVSVPRHPHHPAS